MSGNVAKSQSFAFITLWTSTVRNTTIHLEIQTFEYILDWIAIAYFCSLLHNHKLLRKDLYRNCVCKTYLEDSPNPPHSNFKINNKLYGKGMKWSLYWVWGSHAFLNVFERQTSKKPWHPLIAYFSGRVKINLCYLLVKSAFSEQYLLKQFPPLGQSQSSKHSPLI